MNWPSKQCPPAQRELLTRYAELITAHNTTVNLVSRKDIDQIWPNHIEPCLAFTVLERILPDEKVIDIGSGGGLPGIVNAIMFPTSEHVLVDSTQKKVLAMQAIITELGLTNVQAIWSRVEELPYTHPQWQRYFDRATSRAVAPLAQLAAWASPLVKQGGTIEALKGGDLTTERSACPYPVTGYKLPDMYKHNEKLQTAIIASIQLP